MTQFWETTFSRLMTSMLLNTSTKSENDIEIKINDNTAMSSENSTTVKSALKIKTTGSGERKGSGELQLTFFGRKGDGLERREKPSYACDVSTLKLNVLENWLAKKTSKPIELVTQGISKQDHINNTIENLIRKVDGVHEKLHALLSLYQSIMRATYERRRPFLDRLLSDFLNPLTKTQRIHLRAVKDKMKAVAGEDSTRIDNLLDLNESSFSNPFAFGRYI